MKRKWLSKYQILQIPFRLWLVCFKQSLSDITNLSWSEANWPSSSFRIAYPTKDSKESSLLWIPIKRLWIILTLQSFHWLGTNPVSAIVTFVLVIFWVQMTALSNWIQLNASLKLIIFFFFSISRLRRTAKSLCPTNTSIELCFCLRFSQLGFKRNMLAFFIGIIWLREVIKAVCYQSSL